MIPLFKIEEHHEAFIVWNYAVKKGWMSPSDNCLFHVDEHSDMGTPRFNRSIHANKNIQDIINFTYNELNIASFIIPACYIDIFNKVYWIRQRHNKIIHKPRKMYVRSYNQKGKYLISGKEPPKNNIFDKDKRLFDYYLRTIDQIPMCSKVVLDIDLDYFSCSGNPNTLEEIYIEITEIEYNSFVNNKYNRLKYCNIGKIEAVSQKGKHYYIINNYSEVYPEACKVSENEIIERIDTFVSILSKRRINPTIICICRSRYSGYTPREQWEFIESSLVSKLKEIYVIENYTHAYEMDC